MAAVVKLTEEETANEDEAQQGKQNAMSDLADRWLKQVKYENFMECARKMWD